MVNCGLIFLKKNNGRQQLHRRLKKGLKDLLRDQILVNLAYKLDKSLPVGDFNFNYFFDVF